VSVALETGLRKAELLGFTWERVDLSRGVLRLEVTKSGRRREVPMRQAAYNRMTALPGPREARLCPARKIRTAFRRDRGQPRGLPVPRLPAPLRVL
jgi:integrase